MSFPVPADGRASVQIHAGCGADSTHLHEELREVVAHPARSSALLGE
jgi:hypothetical protein